MSIEFRCSQCSQLLRVPDDAAGKSARCPKCQLLMIVPSATAVVVPGSTPSPMPPLLNTPAPTEAYNPFASSSAGVAPPAKPFAGSAPFGTAASASQNPYAPPSAAANVYQPQTDWVRPGLPWENQRQTFATWWETTKLCMMQPSYAFSIMRRTGGLGQPMLFAGIGLAIGLLGQLFWLIPFLMLIALIGAQGQAGAGELAAVTGAQIFIQVFRSVMGVVMGATLGLLIWAAILHVCLMAVGGAKQPFETTLRVLGYAQGATAWLNVIPGGFIAVAVWMLVLEIIGLAKAHEIDMGKSALAVFLPMIVICGCVLGFLAVIIGIAIAANAR